MTASLKALQAAKDKTVVLMALLSLASWISPATMKAHAQTVVQEKGLIFEVKTELPNSSENQNSQTKEDIDKKVALLRQYLEAKGSPLAQYTEILLAQEDWKTILAISNAESTLGKRCYYNNCSGIYERFDRGYAGLKKYDSMAEWIVDLQGLLNRRYEGWSLDKMNGVYVYPRSSSWIRATSQVYNDLSKVEAKFPLEA